MSKLLYIIPIFLIVSAAGAVLLMKETRSPSEKSSEQVDSTDFDIQQEPQAGTELIDELQSSSEHGTYVDYSEDKFTEGTNILFFYASWCPTCAVLNKNLESTISDIPEEMTILKVDFDNAKDLKDKYGVTYQHTLVQVDKDGNLIKKWNESYTVQEIIDQVV